MTAGRAHIALVLASAVAASTAANAAPQAVGQAEIAGTVVTTGTPATPLARALVTISGESLRPGRTTITDAQGRFVFPNLPAGAFTIVAARPPYVSSAYGAKRPARPGTPISLAAGQRLTGITIALARGAAITGMIRNAGGEPAPGTTIEVTPLDTRARPLAAPIVTDDRGIYRAFGLPPGRYLVTAGVSGDPRRVLTRLSDAEMDVILARLQRRAQGVAAPESTTTPAVGAGARPAGPDPEARPAAYGYAPIYYPGTADPDQAAVITLDAGEERAGVDIDLRLVRMAAVAGHVANDGSGLPMETRVTLTRLGLSGGAAKAAIAPAATTRPDAAGGFRFDGVLPGKYRVVARVLPRPRAAADWATDVRWALADVTVGDDDMSDVVLSLQPGLRLSGRIEFDGRAQAALADPTTVDLSLTDADGGTVTPPWRGRADGTFEVGGILPGTYVVTSSQSAAGWWLRSVVVGGRDVLDFPLELGLDGDVTGVVATFTDRHSELSGTLQTASAVPAPDYFVVVFPADRAYWRPAARRVQFARPTTEGRFSFRDLPAGDYLIAALTDMEPSDLADATFLEGLVSLAVPVKLGDGETKTQDLRITGTGRSLLHLSPRRMMDAMALQFTAVFRKVPEGYVGFVEELPGANTQGATLAEARANLQEAVAMVLQANRELSEAAAQGLAVPEP
jgi:predicted RNase H-like HicB family nuclease